MTQVQYCKKCLYPSTKPDLWFKDGVCGACHAYDERTSYDWTTGSEVFKNSFRIIRKIQIMIALFPYQAVRTALTKYGKCFNKDLIHYVLQLQQTS